jgi:hypothetical protein
MFLYTYALLFGIFLNQKIPPDLWFGGMLGQLVLRCLESHIWVKEPKV